MALTGAELTDEVQALVGRTAASEPLIDNTRVTRWLNEAQKDICEKCPGLHDMRFKNISSIDTTQSLQYSLADVTSADPTGTNMICHLFDIWYLDGNESRKLSFVPTDEFDLEHPDPTHSDMDFQKPSQWTRRGDYIELYPLCACAYCDKDLRIDGDVYAGDFTTEDTSASDLQGADDGMIYYAVMKAWGAIGKEDLSVIWRQKYLNWLEDYKEQNDAMYEWDYNFFSDLDE